MSDSLGSRIQGFEMSQDSVNREADALRARFQVCDVRQDGGKRPD